MARAKPVVMAVVSGETVERLEELLQTLKSSCEEALNGSWDRSDDGFEAMVTDCEEALALLRFRILRF